MRPQDSTPTPPIARVCELCGKGFAVYPSTIARGGGKFCSLGCTNAARLVPLEVRFWRLVQKGPGCWLWLGRLNKKGYGILDRGGHTRNGGRPVLAHRVSYALHYGPFPDELLVCHDCPGGDNPACVHPDHLWLGTNADNAGDMAAKGRSNRGERCPAAKLTDERVREIRHRWAAGGIRQKELAGQYGISRGTMSEILAGKLWKHLL